MQWILQQHGDSYEKQWWSKIKPNVPNYEFFWQQHVVPLTMRDIQEHDIGLRPGVPWHLADIATANYGTFIHLAQSHDELENKSRIVEPVGFYSFYSHLYTIVDAMIPRFLSAANKVLDYYNVPIFTKKRQNERFKAQAKDSLNRELAEFTERLDKYRGLLIHDYPFILANGKVPRPEKASEYNSLKVISKIRQNPMLIDTDFEETIPRCESDLGELEQLLNEIWDVVLKEFNSLPKEYKEDQTHITADDRAFAGSATFFEVQMHASHSLNIP